MCFFVFLVKSELIAFVEDNAQRMYDIIVKVSYNSFKLFRLFWLV